MFSSSSSCSSRPLPIPSHHQGTELGPRVQLSAARVPDVVSHVHIAHPLRREHVGDDRSLELSLVVLLKPAQPADVRACPFRVAPVPCAASKRLCLVPRLGARRRRRSYFQRGLQLSLGLLAQLFTEEALVTILYGFHAGLEKQATCLRPRFDIVSCPAATAGVSSVGSPSKARRRDGALRVHRSSWCQYCFPVPCTAVAPLSPRRGPRPSAPAPSAPADSSCSCSASNTATNAPFVHFTFRAPLGSEAMADARSPARRIGLALLQRSLGRAHVQVLPGAATLKTALGMCIATT
eukprot:tig00020801_g13988.t1